MLRRTAFLARCTALCGLLVLAGCAVVPGMGTVGPYSEPQPADPQAQGRITPISLALVNSQAQARARPLPPEVEALFGEPERYVIGPGDVVGVIVYDHPELLPNAGAVISQSADPTGVQVAPGFIVDSGGEIAFPYVGRIRIAGLTEAEASALLARRIAAQIRDPQVTVRIQSFRSRRVYVEGEVRSPGSQIVTDVPMTLSEALNRAGGISGNGNRAALTLLRDGVSIPLDLTRLREAGRNANEIPLRHGDVLRVAHREDSKVFVMGEVVTPLALPMRSNGRLSLSEALGEAGGPAAASSDPSQIYVIRQGAMGEPAIFHLDARNPAALAVAQQFQLDAHDVVYVDPVPLVRWNRVVSLILPSTQAVSNTSQAVNNASDVRERNR